MLVNTVRRFVSITVLILFTSVGAFADGIPQWLSQASAGAVPAYEKDVPAVVLLNEQIVSLENDGKLVTTENFAIRVLTRDGRRFAIARAFYLASAGKVRSIDAWLIRSDKTTKEYTKQQVLDVIADDEDVYNEGRVKIIDATDDVDVNSIFAFSVVTEENPLFYQDRWEFQNRLPTIRSRYALNLPSGWTATSITFNAAEVKPTITGNSYSWEMQDLAPIPPEPMSPSVVNLSPRIVVNYSNQRTPQANSQVFDTWTDVSKWGTTMHDPFVIVDDTVAAKARELTANSKTEYEKIRAIGTFVQNLQYISIDIGVAHGNGYRPRPSNAVLTRGYGDCKDKANLMRAMLKVLKIEAYPVFIYSGDARFVREQWPSPRQFNHCIIAVRVSAETKAPTVMDHPKLGRLLIFDATDQYTPVGDLPDYLQGSFAVIAAGEAGGLSKMPIAPPENDLLERTVVATLEQDGNLQGTISEKALGQTFVAFRRETREYTPAEYRKGIEGWLTRGATAAQLNDLKYSENADASSFHLDIDFRAPKYGQVMQGRLLVFKPVVVSRRFGTSLTDAKRSSPIEIESSMLTETASFKLPVGFAVDEVPDAATLETDFGKYTTSYEIKGDQLVFKRSLRLSRTLVPAEKYETVRNFYLKIRDAEQAPVVLIKK